MIEVILRRALSHIQLINDSAKGRGNIFHSSSQATEKITIAQYRNVLCFDINKKGNMVFCFDKHHTRKNMKKVVVDVFLNIIASALPVAMLQLILYPKVARIVGGDEYGLMLTIYSIWIMISNSLGNVLNNIRLLYYPQYNKLNEQGDDTLLLWKWIPVSSVIVFVFIWTYCGSFSVIHVILGTLVSISILFKAYLEVGFRIKLEFWAILINNLLLSIGFLLGYYLFKVTNAWEMIFLIGYSFSCIFCILKTGLLAEKPNKTSINKKVTQDAYSLLVAAVIGCLVNYADKLVLYPLMGGTSVSIYYTATILGKITGMLTGPINSVILSYITRWDNSKIGIFTKVLFIGIGIVSVAYFVTVFCARPILGLLFPQWIDEVMNILPYTTITIMLTVLSSFLQPFIMKYCKLQWQIGISSIGSASYFICALVLWKIIGLKGFCIGTIIGSLTKLMISILVYYYSIGRLKVLNNVEDK